MPDCHLGIESILQRKLDRTAVLIKLITMIQTLDALTLGAIELPPDQRFALAQRILASVEPEEILETDEAWALEIKERMRKYDCGETLGVPAGEVFAELDRRLNP
ncbi:MAG: addiction module protein [Verrucomicrobiota bacterium]